MELKRVEETKYLTNLIPVPAAAPGCWCCCCVGWCWCSGGEIEISG